MIFKFILNILYHLQSVHMIRDVLETIKDPSLVHKTICLSATHWAEVMALLVWNTTFVFLFCNFMPYNRRLCFIFTFDSFIRLHMINHLATVLLVYIV